MNRTWRRLAVDSDKEVKMEKQYHGPQKLGSTAQAYVLHYLMRIGTMLKFGMRGPLLPCDGLGWTHGAWAKRRHILRIWKILTHISMSIRFIYTIVGDVTPCACVLSHFSSVWFFVILWTVALQAPLSMKILQARVLEWVAVPSSSGSSPPRDQIHVSWGSFIVGRFFNSELLVKPCSLLGDHNYCNQIMFKLPHNCTHLTR